MLLWDCMAPTRRIDQDSPVPYYYQLEQILIGDIESGHYKPGDRLPSEHELCATFDVSRTVVRQALTELETGGWLQRRKGRGTFVAPRKVPEYLFQNLTGLYEDVAARGGVLRSDVRQLERIAAPAPVAAELEINEGDPVIVLDRLRFVDELPWVVAITYIPYELCPQLLEEDMSTQSLYGVLEDKYGIKISYGRRSVESIRAPAAVVRALGIRYGAPSLKLHSTSYDEHSRPVEHFVAHHRGDLSRFEVYLVRRRGATVPRGANGVPTMVMRTAD
jgi:GntR family transcriptional regulator